MRVCLGQINTTPGDFEGNCERIRRGIAEAAAGSADLVVFPELSIPGYLSQDLVYHPSYVGRNEESLRELRAYARGLDEGLTVIVGLIGRSTSATAKPFTNLAAVLCGGETVAIYQKHLLPFYDVFDELRYFEPGADLVVVDVAGTRVGVTICEDLWNDKGSDSYNYDDNPVARYREGGVDVIVSLNSSPFIIGKPLRRLQMAGSISRGGPAIVYVNQRGGQDELVFDGHSFVVARDNLLHLVGGSTDDAFPIIDLRNQSPLLENVSGARERDLAGSTASLKDLLVLGLRDYVVKSGFEQAVVASSGGVDSAVVTALACEALGPRNVHAIRLPSVFSSEHSVADARALHRNLGCWDYRIPVDHEPLVQMIRTNLEVHGVPENLVETVVAEGRYNEVADENIQARMRDLFVMHFSNAYGAMPLATGNKTESACGYYTHFDMNFSYAPIKDLYKFQVAEVARAVAGMPPNIPAKAPSAELSAGQRDEDSLLPYAFLDPIVMAHVEDYVSTFDDFVRWLDAKVVDATPVTSDLERLEAWVGSEPRADYERIIGLIGRMEYKRRQTCPGTKVSKVAFGIGRRIPIVERWN